MASKIFKLVKEFGLIEGLVFYARFKGNRLGWFRSKRKGIRFYLRSGSTDKSVFASVFLQNQYDIPLNFEPKTILDLGANIGLSALYFAKRFPQAQIIGVEPDKENFELAIRNTEVYSNVQLFNKGVWNKEAYIDIVDANSRKDAFMVVETSTPNASSIEAVSIGHLMQQAQWDTIDVLKIDIEGSEKELFAENVEPWLPYAKLIFVEVHDHMRMGASRSVFAATSKYQFSFDMKDENLIFLNQAYQ
jgi:FkbM family methyltransferase